MAGMDTSDIASISPEMAQILYSMGGNKSRAPQNVGEGLTYIGEKINEAAWRNVMLKSMQGNQARESAALKGLYGNQQSVGGQGMPRPPSPAIAESTPRGLLSGPEPAQRLVPQLDPAVNAQTTMPPSVGRPAIMGGETPSSPVELSQNSPAIAPAAQRGLMADNSVTMSQEPQPQSRPQPQPQATASLSRPQPAGDPRIGRLDEEIARHKAALAQLPSGSKFVPQITARLAALEERRFQMDDPGRGLDLQLKQHMVEEKTNPSAAFERRKRIAIENGLKPGTPEYNQFLFNGQISPRSGAIEETTTQKEVAKTRVDMAEKNIKAAYGAQDTMNLVGQLKALSEAKNFEGAIGPVAGNSIYQTIVGGALPFSETAGIANREVHAKLKRLQSALEVAGGEKMRGLGSQSDSDAARLSRAVGDLTSARTTKEFNDALAIIEDSVKGAIARGQAAAKDFPELGNSIRQPNDAAQPKDPNVIRKQLPDGTWARKVNGQWFKE